MTDETGARSKRGAARGAVAAPPRAIQAAMDTLLTTYGCYIPVELLLALGRLRYTDYEAWRRGERPSLQSALAGNPRRVLALLETAAEWAARLGLHPEPQVYFGWGANASARLSFLDPDWHASEPLLATHYVHGRAEAAEAEQFDLFLDGGATAALADLRAALRGRDAAGAERALAVLVEREPGHRLRPAAERLTDALASLPIPLARTAVEAELRAIEQSLVPAARDVLGAEARDVLVPFWQRLAAALDGGAFDAERPRLHAGYAYARALDWPRAVAAIEAVPGHDETPELLGQLAEARFRDRDRSGAIAAWCRMCWRAPGAAAQCLDAASFPDFGVREAWFAFLELDAEPAATFFPAYLLLAEPGLAKRLPEDLGEADAEPGERAFSAMRALFRVDDTESRRSLRAAAAWLLEEYLQVREADARRPERR